MGLFDRFKRLVKEDAFQFQIYAPISGQIIPIEAVPDVIFSEKILGDGVAIEALENQLIAPISGTITHLFAKTQALIIENEHLTVFVRFGLKPMIADFEIHCQLNQVVTIGDLLMSFIQPEKKQALFVPVILLNGDELTFLSKAKGAALAGQSPILFINSL